MLFLAKKEFIKLNIFFWFFKTYFYLLPRKVYSRTEGLERGLEIQDEWFKWDLTIWKRLQISETDGRNCEKHTALDDAYCIMHRIWGNILRLIQNVFKNIILGTIWHDLEGTAKDSCQGQLRGDIWELILNIFKNIILDTISMIWKELRRTYSKVESKPYCKNLYFTFQYFLYTSITIISVIGM